MGTGGALRPKSLGGFLLALEPLPTPIENLGYDPNGEKGDSAERNDRDDENGDLDSVDVEHGIGPAIAGDVHGEYSFSVPSFVYNNPACIASPAIGARIPFSIYCE
jgi:hypothetical protein